MFVLLLLFKNEGFSEQESLLEFLFWYFRRECCLTWICVSFICCYISLSNIGGCEATKLVLVFDGKSAVLFGIELFSCDWFNFIGCEWKGQFLVIT